MRSLTREPISAPSPRLATKPEDLKELRAEDSYDIWPEFEPEDQMQKASVSRKRRFLQAIRQGATVTTACMMIPISRNTFDGWRDNLDFEAAYQRAHQEKIDLIEERAFQLAFEGVNKMVVSAGKLIGTEVVYSERLIEFFLKSHRRETYGDKREITGAGGAPLVPVKPEVTVVFVAEVVDLIRQAGVRMPDVLEGESVDNPLALAETSELPSTPT